LRGDCERILTAFWFYYTYNPIAFMFTP